MYLFNGGIFLRQATLLTLGGAIHRSWAIMPPIDTPHTWNAPTPGQAQPSSTAVDLVPFLGFSIHSPTAGVGVDLGGTAAHRPGANLAGIEGDNSPNAPSPRPGAPGSCGVRAGPVPANPADRWHRRPCPPACTHCARRDGNRPEGRSGTRCPRIDTYHKISTNITGRRRDEVGPSLLC